MPAVTVNNIPVLPRVHQPDPAVAKERAVRSVTSAPSGYEGEGFPVRRAFAGVDLKDLDPFIHMDQMGEVEYAPGEPKGTRTSAVATPHCSPQRRLLTPAMTEPPPSKDRKAGALS